VGYDADVRPFICIPNCKEDAAKLPLMIPLICSEVYVAGIEEKVIVPLEPVPVALAMDSNAPAAPDGTNIP
jgi:hypothetical protein